MNEPMNEPSKDLLLLPVPCPLEASPKRSPEGEGLWVSVSPCLDPGSIPLSWPTSLLRKVRKEHWGDGLLPDIVAPEWQPQLCSSSVA